MRFAAIFSTTRVLQHSAISQSNYYVARKWTWQACSGKTACTELVLQQYSFCSVPLTMLTMVSCFCNVLFV